MDCIAIPATRHTNPYTCASVVLVRERERERPEPESADDPGVARKDANYLRESSASPSASARHGSIPYLPRNRARNASKRPSRMAARMSAKSPR